MKPYYEDAFATIFHADCREVLAQLGQKSCELAVTSPPYNLVREGSGGYSTSFPALDSAQEGWYADEKDEALYVEEQREVISSLLKICKGSVFYNHKVRYALKRRGEIFHPLDWIRDFPLWCEIIWDRGGATGGNSRRYLISDERIFQIGKPSKFFGAMGYTTVWRIPPETLDVHPCPFPP